MREVRGAGAAVAAAFEEQRRAGPDAGVGVACGDGFVQWCRDGQGALYLVEVQPGSRRDAVLPALLAGGFTRHSSRRLARQGLLEHTGGPLAAGGTDPEVAAVLLALLGLLGADEQSDLSVFP